MIRKSTRRSTAALAVPLMLGTALTGCADKHLDYLTDYSNHRPLRVTGHPSTDSLEAVQKVVWRLADGDVEGLAALNTEGGDARPAARAWIKEYGKAAARDEAAADFYEEGSVRQGIVLVNPEPKDVKKSGPAPTTR
ncbi:hypothetical protein GTY41_23580 [Streptomyces sp. SID685]|uniref:hypothetical protein n=1 Tax=Streptomyces sp. SID685 TaxID=2690322 RepID=UPI00136E4995|nr:hypothetical protein [Streptomyces sp. SID685]MYR87824.1 hypothetical protein [Streptomyces sp. SID685]